MANATMTNATAKKTQHTQIFTIQCRQHANALQKETCSTPHKKQLTRKHASTQPEILLHQHARVFLNLREETNQKCNINMQNLASTPKVKPHEICNCATANTTHRSAKVYKTPDANKEPEIRKFPMRRAPSKIQKALDSAPLHRSILRHCL